VVWGGGGVVGCGGSRVGGRCGCVVGNRGGGGGPLPQSSGGWWSPWGVCGGVWWHVVVGGNQRSGQCTRLPPGTSPKSVMGGGWCVRRWWQEGRWQRQWWCVWCVWQRQCVCVQVWGGGAGVRACVVRVAAGTRWRCVCGSVRAARRCVAGGAVRAWQTVCVQCSAGGQKGAGGWRHGVVCVGGKVVGWW